MRASATLARRRRGTPLLPTSVAASGPAAVARCVARCGLVIVGAVAMMAFAAATFAGRPEFGHFTDAGAVAAGLEAHVGRAAGVMFALALIDACIIGASAVSLATAYAVGDVLSLKRSLHRRPSDAKGFYAIHFCLIAFSAALVLTPGVPLGLLTNAVQTLAGVLLPSATVFLLLLCNDKAVLGPWAATGAGRGLGTRGLAHATARHAAAGAPGDTAAALAARAARLSRHRVRACLTARRAAGWGGRLSRHGSLSRKCPF